MCLTKELIEQGQYTLIELIDQCQIKIKMHKEAIEKTEKEAREAVQNEQSKIDYLKAQIKNLNCLQLV